MTPDRNVTLTKTEAVAYLTGKGLTEAHAVNVVNAAEITASQPILPDDTPVTAILRSQKARLTPANLDVWAMEPDLIP